MASTNERGNHGGYEHREGYYRGGYEHHGGYERYEHDDDHHYGGYRGWGRKLMSQLLPAAAAVHPAAANPQTSAAIPPTPTTTSANERGGYGHSHGGYGGHSHGGYHGGHYGGHHHHHHHGGHGGWGRKLLELVGISSTALPTPQAADLSQAAKTLSKPAATVAAADKPTLAKLQGSLDSPAAPLGPDGTTQPASSANERGNYYGGHNYGGYNHGGHGHGGYNHGGHYGGYNHGGHHHEEHRHGGWGRKLTSEESSATATPQATPDLSYRAASHNGAPHVVPADVTTAPQAAPTTPQAGASVSTPATPEPTTKPNNVPVGASTASLAAPTTQPAAGASNERGNYGGYGHGGYHHGHGGYNPGGHYGGGYNHGGYHSGHRHEEHRHGGWGRKMLNLLSTPANPQATGPLAVPTSKTAGGASNERGNHGGYGHGHGGYGGHGHGYEHHGGYNHHNGHLW